MDALKEIIGTSASSKSYLVSDNDIVRKKHHINLGFLAKTLQIVYDIFFASNDSYANFRREDNPLLGITGA